jgi:hypothetical protein
MKLIKYSAVIAVVVIFAVLVIVVMKGQSVAVVQPIPFNHQLHAGDQEIECTTCHTGVEKLERAGFPVNDICEECHSEESSGTETEKRMLEYVTGKRAIPWQRIYRVPDHVYFSHRRHVVSGKVRCESCHGNVKELKEPPQYPIVSLSMDFCMDCHEKQKVSNDCLACHI